MGAELILPILGTVWPSIVDITKKLFLKGKSDTTSATINTLATTNPSVIPDFIRANTERIGSEVSWFNRDVIGTPHQWVISLRSAIRPVVVSLSVLALVFNHVGSLNLSPNVVGMLGFNVANWMSSRATQG